MITPSFSLTATERVLPKLALDFTTASLDSRVTFTRTTGASNPATYVNSSGVVTVATNNQPRFDYDPVTLACKGLLIEESRTNLMTYSSDYSNAIWGTKSGISLASGVAAPDVSTSTLVENTSAGTRYVGQTATVTTATAYTATVYMKKGTTNIGAMSVVESPNQGFWTFDLNTGVVGNNVVSSKASTASITDAGGGWYRCSITITTAATSISVRILPVTSVSVATGAVGDNINVWGAQLEAGAFATSYIPTTTAALTRNADVATMTGTNFSDWFNASEGTFACKFQLKSTSQVSTSMLSANGGSTNNRIEIGLRSTGTNVSVVTVSAATTAILDFGSPTTNVTNQTIAYKENSFAGAKNGGTIGTDSAGTIPTVSVLDIGSRASSAFCNGWIQNVNYWPQRVTNNEAQAFSKE